VLVFVIGRWQRQRVPAPIWKAAFVVAVISVAALATLAVLHPSDDVHTKSLSAPPPANEAKQGKPVHVYDKVTSGVTAMREDFEPIYLLTRAAALCGGGHCRIPGTKRETGGVYRSAVCQGRGEWVTNGNAESELDNGNPGLFGSHLYYGVRLDEETFGYVSQVWISPKDRGLELPAC
jgi:hypothetical protein